MADFEGKKVLVTGAAGFIGSHLCDRLLEEPLAQLVGVDNLFLGKENNLTVAKADSRFLFERLDVTDSEKLEGLCKAKNFDVIFHLAVIPLPVSLERPVWCFHQNVMMSENICEIVRHSGKKVTVIHFSSSEVYGSAVYTPMDENHPLDSHTPYAASKAAADLLTISYHHTFGIDMAIVRPFNNYGPRQNEGSYAGVIPITIKRILNGQAPIITGDGKQTRDFVYVKDTVDATVEIYRNERTRGEVYNLSSGKQTSIEAVVNAICHKMNYDGEILHHHARPGDVLRHEGNAKKIHEAVGYVVKVGIEQGIGKTINWYLENLSSKGN